MGEYTPIAQLRDECRTSLIAQEEMKERKRKRKIYWEERYNNQNTETSNNNNNNGFIRHELHNKNMPLISLRNNNISSANYSSYFFPDENDTDDSSDENSILPAKAVITSSFKLLKEALNALLEDANENTYSVNEICHQLSIFRKNDKLKYQQAYISLSLPKLLQPFVMMDVIVTPWIYEQVRTVRVVCMCVCKCLCKCMIFDRINRK